MSRDFEVRQLLRAYRSGLMSEAAFEEEMLRLEHEVAGGQAAGEPPPGFEAMGRRFRSEREAVITFLDQLHAVQMDVAVGFAKWATVCRTTGLRTGLMMIAERDAYHARALERRARELGGELHSTATEEGGKLVALLANREVADLEKLVALNSLVPDPQAAIAPIADFAALLKSDIETKQALRLIAEDELSTANWLRDLCVELAQAQSAAAGADPRA